MEIHSNNTTLNNLPQGPALHAKQAVTAAPLPADHQRPAKLAGIKVPHLVPHLDYQPVHLLVDHRLIIAISALMITSHLVTGHTEMHLAMTNTLAP